MYRPNPVELYSYHIAEMYCPLWRQSFEVILFFLWFSGVDGEFSTSIETLALFAVCKDGDCVSCYYPLSVFPE